MKLDYFFFQFHIRKESYKKIIKILLILFYIAKNVFFTNFQQAWTNSTFFPPKCIRRLHICIQKINKKRQNKQTKKVLQFCWFSPNSFQKLKENSTSLTFIGMCAFPLHNIRLSYFNYKAQKNTLQMFLTLFLLSQVT